nr:MAG TPA: hypothetical protein [Caudoviricetes sp.]
MLFIMLITLITCGRPDPLCIPLPAAASEPEALPSLLLPALLFLSLCYNVCRRYLS